MGAEQDVRECLKRVAHDLHLDATDGAQDWGIERSDPRRLDEFLRYYERSSEAWPPWAHHEYAFLVFQSANEAMEDGLPVPRRDIERFAHAIGGVAPSALSYWTSLMPTDADPWPLPRLLRELGAAG